MFEVENLLIQYYLAIIFLVKVKKNRATALYLSKAKLFRVLFGKTKISLSGFGQNLHSWQSVFCPKIFVFPGPGLLGL